MLLGSVLKRRASLDARRLLAAAVGSGNSVREREIRRSAEAMAATLEQAAAAYRRAEGLPGDSRFNPAAALNRLALDALTPGNRDSVARGAALALAQRSRDDATQRLARSPTARDAMLVPESMLVESLLDGSLGRTAAAGQAAFERLAQAYADTLAEPSLTPADIGAMASQLALLSLFCDALGLVRDGEALRRTAERLQDLAQLLQPARKRRQPPPAPARAAAKKAARNAAAKRGRP